MRDVSDMTCPTVKIKAGDGHVVINESDFDKSVHQLFDGPVLPPPAPLPPPPGAPDPLAALGKDWKNKDVGELRKLAEVVSGRAVENKAQAVAVIEAALAKSAA